MTMDEGLEGRLPLSGQFNTKPLYQQVADEFIGRIVSGAWQPGQAIENEADLARSLGISLGTVRKAFEILTEFELLERHQGRGTVIADLASSLSRFSNIRDGAGARFSGRIEVFGASLKVPCADMAARLGINQRTPVLAFKRRRFVGERIFMIEDAFLRVDASSRAMSVAALDERARERWMNVDLATAKRETVLPGRCDADDAISFGIPAGSPILLLERVIFSHRGRPLEFRRARCHLSPDLTYLCG